MRRNLWWHAAPRWSPVFWFQLLIGFLCLVIIIPIALLIGWFLHWKEEG